ncbi:MAG: hypothetical protein ACON4I_10025 [Candidatus Puniceispirillaceae bacterium]
MALVKQLEAGSTVPEIAAFTSQGFDMVEYYARDHNRVLLTKRAAAKASQNPLDPDRQ